jgi:hypothetical protein
MTDPRKVPGTTALVAGGFLLLSGPVRGDCYEYRPTNAEWRLVYDMQQGSSEQRSGLLGVAPFSAYDAAQRKHYTTEDRWIGNTDFLVIEAVSLLFEPKVIVTAGQAIVAQSFVDSPDSQQKRATLHLSGREVHQHGSDGWMRIFFTSEGPDGVGDYAARITSIVRISPRPENHCNTRFIPLQGDFACPQCGDSAEDQVPGTSPDLGDLGGTPPSSGGLSDDPCLLGQC